MKNISKFIIDETQIKVGKDYFWLWVAIEPKDKDILHIHISSERNTFCCRTFSAWYPSQACKFLQIKLHYHLYSSYDGSIIERRIQYIKNDRTEDFDDYFPCRKERSVD